MCHTDETPMPEAALEKIEEALREGMDLLDDNTTDGHYQLFKAAYDELPEYVKKLKPGTY